MVSIIELRPDTLTVTEDLPGRVAALRIAEIRAQVGGIIQRRHFEEGSELKAGQPMFTLSAAPFKAEAAAAAAAERRAEAALVRAEAQVRRLEPLVRVEAVSGQAFDDARTDRDLAAADLAQARANLERRKVELAYTVVTTPIAGRVDQALQTEGALVAPGDASPLARVMQIDRVYVDLRQPAARFESLRHQRGSPSASVPVTLLSPGGEALDLKARALFSGLSVDPGTGEALLRVLVDNPQRTLLPGMFVRARVPLARYDEALLVPQQAVQMLARPTGAAAEASGVPEARPADTMSTSGAAQGTVQARVWVYATGTGQVRAVNVVVAERIGGRYRVQQGLHAGDRVVITGMDRLSEGAKVQAVSSALF